MPRPVIITPHQVYRYFDKDGTLIYVGCTLNARRRLAEHRAASPWGGEITRMEVADFPSKEAGLNAEREAIRTESPKYNEAKYDTFLRPLTPLPDLYPRYGTDPMTPNKMNCLQCGDEFTIQRSTAKYCSNKCRLLAHRGVVHKPNKLALEKPAASATVKPKGEADTARTATRKPRRKLRAAGSTPALPADNPMFSGGSAVIDGYEQKPNNLPVSIVFVNRPLNIAPPNLPASSVRDILAKLPSRRPHNPAVAQA